MQRKNREIVVPGVSSVEGGDKPRATEYENRKGEAS